MHQLIEQDAQSPYINSVVVALPGKEFRCHVFIRATEGPHGLVLGSDGRPPEVAQLDIMVLVEEQIFRLMKVSVKING